MCGDCKYGICNNNGVICNNPQSDNFDMQMDYSDTCIKCRKVKIIKKKVVEPVVIEEHIANPIIESPLEKPKEKPKKKKNYAANNIKVDDVVFVIVSDDHIAGFKSCVNEFGGKHIFYHEEGLARDHCERLTNEYVKYKYIKCKINNEL